MTVQTANIHLRHWSEATEGDASFLPRLRLIRLTKGNDEVCIIQEGNTTAVIPNESSAEEQGVMQVDEEGSDPALL